MLVGISLSFKSAPQSAAIQDNGNDEDHPFDDLFVERRDLQ
jgi:hypothetical protein